jgi:RHS repeat-associated protein
MYSDSETGLYYWGSRYYDPKTGRSITPDRMSVAEHVRRWQANQNRLNRPPLEINPYVYVANNPLRWTDRTGRVIETWEPSDSITHDPIGWGLPGSTGSPCGSGFTFPAYTFGPACVRHDECYGTCGTSKTWCDFQFLWNMQRSCQAGDWGCGLRAQLYFEAVLHFGGGPYNRAQEGCEGGKCKQ